MQVVNLVLSLPIVDCQLPIEKSQRAAAVLQIGNWQSTIGNS